MAYRPGHPIQATVTVVNPTKEAFAGRLAWKELCGLDGVSDADEQKITVEAGAVARVVGKWKARLPEAGRELRIELRNAQKQMIHTATDYYGIAKDPSFLCVINWGVGMPGRQSFQRFAGLNYASTASRGQLKEMHDCRKAAHSQRAEVYSWSYCDMAQFIPPPEEEPYLGTETSWWKGYKMVKEDVRLMKSIGITPISYIGAYFWGPAAYRLYQQHPEWFLPGFYYDMQARAKYERRHELEFAQDHGQYFQAEFNPLLPETRRYMADQIIQIGKETGFEGVRMDAWDMEIKRGDTDFMGRELARTDEEADRLSAENIATVKALVARELPDFTWGYNFGSREENARSPLTLAEKCRGGGWLLDEMSCNYQEKTSPYHFWKA